MKICFLSGPKKPSKCGISDYIKLISLKLKKLGNDCDHVCLDEKCTLSNIAQNLPDADLYSIQFAPYAFSTTGFSVRGLSDLAKSLRDKNTLLNFHEFWIGAYPNATLKEKTIGWLQKREITNFINICMPSAITCSNSAALDRMRQAGVDAQYLYLCGNIPYSLSKKHEQLNHVTVVFFGTLYGKFPYEHLSKTLFLISQSLKKQIHIKILGRQRESEGLEYLKKVTQKHEFPISLSGEISISKISEELQKSDLGISTTPYDIIGKSGATATILEHRLPILAYDDGDTPKGKLFVMNEFIDQVFLLNDDSTVARMISFLQKPRKHFFDGVAHTAKKMLKIIY